VPQRFVNSFFFARSGAGLSLVAAALVPEARGKMNIDFDPKLDFSKYETFVYIGGVEHHVMLQFNPT
jgi:hypothetical protein